MGFDVELEFDLTRAHGGDVRNGLSSRREFFHVPEFQFMVRASYICEICDAQKV
jgi:hypothetical protein